MISVRTTLTAALVAGLFAGTAGAQLRSHGMPDTLNNFGYPSTYTDQAGVSTVFGWDPTDPLLPAMGEVPFLNDPGAPLSVETGNFFHEIFYWLGGANIVTPDGGDAILVMAVEGVWDNAAEAIIDGDQLVFSRIRLRIDVPNLPSSIGTYTIEHPFGTETFEIDQAILTDTDGRRAINWTNDCLHLDINNPSCGTVMGNQFQNIVDPNIASISHYLRWDPAVEPQAPAGYLGDLITPHAIIGSPVGQNHFRITGPAFDDVGGLETDQFIISGKLGTPDIIQSVGFGELGTTGVPNLAATGDMTTGAPFSLDLRSAAPNTMSTLFVSFSQANMPFQGGTLVPNPAQGFRLPGVTDGNGDITMTGNFPGAPPGTRLYLQWFVNDLTATGGSAGSNSLQIAVP